MWTILFLGILLGFSQVHACEFKPNIQVVSLSGPITYELKYLGLLESEAVKAVSTFHKINQKKYKKKEIGGGVLLSPKTFKQYKESIIFYDTSADIKKSLEQMQMKHIVEVNSRGLTPFETIDYARKKLQPFVQNCDLKSDSMLMDVSKTLESVRNRLRHPILFFLGELKVGRRWPKLLMVHDGFVLSLIKEAKWTSYTSRLPYVPWAQKELDLLQDKGVVIKIGISSEKKQLEGKAVKSKKMPHVYNYYSNTALIPGRPQIVTLQKILQALQAEKSYWISQ